MPHLCPICNAPAQNKCSACHSVSYCSPAHQKEHWKTHRKNCSFFIIKDDPKLGKGFYASRDIKPGTIILDEEPAVLATSWNAPSYFPFPSCMTCGLVMTFEFDKHCSKCKWPVCSEDCEKLPLHAENECKIFATKKFTFPPPAITPSKLRAIVLLLRACLLKGKRPEVYQQILELQSEFAIPLNLNWDSEISVLKSMIDPRSLGIADEELRKLLQIFRINCHSTSFDDQEGMRFRSRSLGYLYVKASRMNHSCAPNCSWTVSRKPEFKMRIRTTIAVKKGEPLTIDYHMRESMYGTKQRQESIRKSGFVCQCPRCKDPTELGTYMSAIVCSSCRGSGSSVGYLLPEDSLDVSPSAVWKCNRCENQRKSSEILPPVEKIGKMIAKKDKELGDEPRNDSLLEFCKTVVSKYSGKSLHPNHWVVQDATRAAFRYLTTHLGNKMDLPTSEYYVKCGLYLLAIEDVISPGLSFNRATLGKQVASALQYQVTELISKERYEQALSNLEQCIKLQTEALQYFQTEFPLPEGSVSKCEALKLEMEFAKRNREQVLQILQTVND